MNAEEFYDLLKETLKFFNLDWGSKNLMEIRLENEKLVFRYKNMSVGIELNGEE